MNNIEGSIRENSTTETVTTMAANMSVAVKKKQLRKLQIYALGLVGILALFPVSFIHAYWRVSRSDRFNGTPFKSIDDSESLFKSLSPKPTAIQPEVKTEVTESVAKVVAAETQRNFLATAAPKTVVITPPVTEITDPQQLQNLKQQLYDRIDKNWQTYTTFNQSLIYQVSVNNEGAIVDYKPLNQLAKNYVKDIPLPELLTQSVDSNSRNHSIAKFTVLFTPNGLLEVNP